MPFKPKTPCRHPGCPELTHERFCPRHAKAEDERYRRFQRDPAINRRYDKTWRKVRARYLDAHPLCEDCAKAGRTTPAAEVHHIVPLGHAGSHDFSNLGPCASPVTPASPHWTVTGGGVAPRSTPTDPSESAPTRLRVRRKRAVSSTV